MKSGILIAAAAVAIGAASLLHATPNPTSRVYHTESWGLILPAGATAEDMVECCIALANDEPLPPGFELDDWGGELDGVDTGVYDFNTGELLVNLTVRDDPDDIAAASVFVDGVRVFSGTPGNGVTVNRRHASFSASFTVGPAGCSVDVYWRTADDKLNYVKSLNY